MARISDEVKRYIVQRLACFDRPSQIAAGVKEEFGVIVSRQQVHGYHPEHGTPAKKWRDLHAETRRTFVAELAKEPAMIRAVRVRRLARMAERAEDRRNDPLAASLYEQIAKEDGGMFTNHRIVTAGDPVKELAMLLGYTPEQLAAAIALGGDGDNDQPPSAANEPGRHV